MIVILLDTISIKFGYGRAEIESITVSNLELRYESYTSSQKGDKTWRIVSVRR